MFKKALNWKNPSCSLVLLLLLLSGCLADIKRSLGDANHSLLQEKGTTVLMRESARGDVVQVKKLLDQGDDVNAINENGYHALMFAAEYGNLTISKILVNHGADIHRTNKHNKTPLFLAALMESLVGMKAIFEFKSSNYIGENDHRGVIDYLVSIGTPIYEISDDADDANNTGQAFVNLANYYLGNGQNATAQDHYQVSMKSFSIASKLYEKESDSSKTWQGVGLVASALYPALRDANQRYQGRIQARERADIAALRDANKYNLNQQETLDLVREYRKSQEQIINTAAPNLNFSPVSIPSNSGGNINIYQWKAETAYQKAILVGTILECYKNEIGKESFVDCVDWARTEFTNFEIENQRELGQRLNRKKN